MLLITMNNNFVSEWRRFGIMVDRSLNEVLHLSPRGGSPGGGYLISTTYSGVICCCRAAFTCLSMGPHQKVTAPPNKLRIVQFHLKGHRPLRWNIMISQRKVSLDLPYYTYIQWEACGADISFSGPYVAFFRVAAPSTKSRAD